MDYLYVDNFKGFSKTLIPIQDVNFFVGENSTGKTTLLNLFYLITGTDFLTNLNFDKDEVSFGPFKEIISVKSKNPFFYIGIVDFESKNFEFVLFTFREEDQYPELCQLNFIKGTREIEFRFDKSEIKYINKKIESLPFSKDLINNLIEKWTSPNRKVKYKNQKYPNFYPKDYPILFRLFLSSSYRNIPYPNFLRYSRRGEDVISIAPIRSKPKRTYDKYNVSFTPEGEHIPYILWKMLMKKDQSSENFKQSAKSIGKTSGLFDDIKLRRFSKAPGSPFSIDVVQHGMNFNIINTGYGVSQSLPIIVEMITESKGATFAIQQPEVHLHPRAQAALGDLLFYLVVKEDKKFLIETHSDFIIDRFRLNLKLNPKESNMNSQVLFFQKTKNGNSVIPIPISNVGQYDEKQPKEFREFFVNESISLLEI